MLSVQLVFVLISANLPFSCSGSLCTGRAKKTSRRPLMHLQELDFVTLPHPEELFTLTLSWHTHMQLSEVHGVNLAFA